MHRPLPVRLVVFDLDGTLVDSSEDIATAVNLTIEQLAPGTVSLPLSEVRSYVGEGATVLVERFLAARRLSAPVAEALPLFLARYRERLLDTTRLYPGVVETLDQLKDRALAVLTNKPGDMSRTILEGLGVAKRFARIWGGGDVPERKPDPGGLRKLMEDCGVAPAETVMVGDSAIDIRTGRAAGARTVGVKYGFAPAGLLAEPPDHLIDDLRRLPALL